MSDERRYDDDEVAAIMERAASEEARAPVASTRGTGLTLAQLQEIGAEVGIAPERIADAARSLSSRPLVPAPRKFLGAPRSVARIVPIPRPLDEDEWSRLVVMLRETFGAEGRIRVHGNLRTWRNGNLQVHVEPDGERYRVRMETVKGDAAPRGVLGAVLMALGVGMLLSRGPEAGGLVAAGLLTLAGLAQFGFMRALLPRWAAERAAQMESLAERIPRLLKQ